MPGVMSKFIEASMKASGAQQDIFDRAQQVEELKQKRIDRERQKIAGELEYYHGILSNADMRLQMDDDTLARLKGEAMNKAQQLGLEWADPDPIPGDMQKFIYDLQTNPKMQGLHWLVRGQMVENKYGVHFERSLANYIHADTINRSMEPKPEVKPGKGAETPAPAFQSMPDTSQPEAQPEGLAPHRAGQAAAPQPTAKEQLYEQMFGGPFYDPYTPDQKQARAIMPTYDRQLFSPDFQNMAITNPLGAKMFLSMRNAQAAVAGMPIIDENDIPQFTAGAKQRDTIITDLGKNYQDIVKIAGSGNSTPEQVGQMYEAYVTNGRMRLGDTFVPEGMPEVKLSPMAKAKIDKIEADMTAAHDRIEIGWAQLDAKKKADKIKAAQGDQSLAIRRYAADTGRMNAQTDIRKQTFVEGTPGRLSLQKYMDFTAKNTANLAWVDAMPDTIIDPNDEEKTIDQTDVKEQLREQFRAMQRTYDVQMANQANQQAGGGKPTAGTAGGTTVSPALRKLATMGERLRPGKNKQDLSDLLNNPKFRNNQVLIGEAINNLRDAFNKGNYD